MLLIGNKSILKGESSLAISFFSLPESVGPILIHTPNKVIDPRNAWRVTDSCFFVSRHDGLFSIRSQYVRKNQFNRHHRNERYVLDIRQNDEKSKANEILNGEGQFTVFVPTNDAFGKVPDAQMNAWLSETDQTRLKSLLSYHIVPGKLFAANLGGIGTAKSVTGQEITFTDNSGIKVNASGMQARNIEASNGIVHGLDTVLTAPTLAATAAGAASTSAATPTPAAIPTAIAAPRPLPRNSRLRRHLPWPIRSLSPLRHLQRSPQL